MANAHWTGELDIGLGWAVYRGPIGEGHTHQHLALQLTISPSGSFDVVLGDQTSSHVQAALVGKHTPHLLEGNHGEVWSLYADPLTGLGTRLAGKCQASKGIAWEEVPFRCNDLLDRRASGNWSETFRRLVDGWLGPTAQPSTQLDRRLTQVTQILNRDLSKQHHLAEVAAEVGLSSSRLSFLFRRDLGMAFRAYVRWTRMVAASNAVAGGANAAEAAYEAGFADQAHFTRTFRSLFGTPPVSGLLSNQFTAS